MRRKKYNRYTFDCASYADSFDFCTQGERKCILRVLGSAWAWGAPKREKKKKKRKVL